MPALRPRAQLRSLPFALRLGLPIVAIGMFTAACGSSASSNTAPAAAGSASTSSTSGGGVALDTHSGKAGTFLTDGSGHSLYLFGSDKGTSSSCAGACASAWPPLTGSAHAGSGVTAADIGSITRSDGTKQITYHGHPLYRFSGDSSAGQTNGQGSNAFGAKWWLVAPSGDAIKGTSGGSSSGGGGYGY